MTTTEGWQHQPPAPYACRSGETRGRARPEPESPMRTPFQRDRNRIIASSAFRRLKHKTQVFVYHEGDYYRTRLTHSLEVAQIARSLARCLAVNEDLAETLALAHDLGHPPFGHAGEEALDEAMRPYGGFDHNGQTLRIVTLLEARYAAFDGLNLTWEALEGLAKHNGPLGGPGGLPWSISEYTDEHDLELASWPGLEAQLAALSDDIAYHAHDVDDGLRAGLFSVDDLADVPVLGPVVAEIRSAYPRLPRTRLVHEIGRRMTDRVLSDAVAETRRRVREAGPRSADEVRAHDGPLAGFTSAMEADNDGLKDFLFAAMYGHHRVRRMAVKARRVVTDLFGVYMEEPECLPGEWRGHAEAADGVGRARLVSDYISGMTDRFALDEHRRLFDPYAENR